MLEVSVEKIVGVFEKVGRDEVNVAEFRFDEKKGDYNYKLGTD